MPTGKSLISSKYLSKMKRPNRLYSLLESATKIRGEYWVLPDGSLLHATDGGDHNHEGWVYEYIVGYYLDAVNQTEWGRQIFGENWADQNGYEYVMFRETLMNGLDEMRLDLDESEEEIDAILIKQFGKEQFDWFYPIVSNGIDRTTGRPVDAREFATQYWKWIRVAFNNAELPDLTPATLKRAGEGFCMIMFEETGEDEPDYEIELTVATYRGDRLTVTLNDLLDGRSKPATARNASHDTLTRYGRAAADKMDQQAQHPFYRNQNNGG